MRRIIEFALRVYSYVMSIASSLGLLGLAVVAKMSGEADSLVVQALPWKGEELTNWLLGLGIVGLISGAGAAFTKGPLRFLLPLWSVYFAYLMVKGNFLSTTKTFDGPTEFYQTISYVAGLVVSAFASLLQLKKRP
ncbi:hypothetical protein F183_A13660 [Bryobacterales bacterium F-183]|nr:hypothetical protein F183_A13660 [Bryobacterales bacterium F-183]